MQTYERTAHCRDLPELVDSVDGEVALAFPDGGLDRIAAAVAARRAPGAVLQEKVDGCWCELTVGEKGRIEAVTSRSGLHLRQAVGWVGEKVHPMLSGWRFVGEVEAGTAWASINRDWHPIPQLHLYGAFNRKGELVKPEKVRALLRSALHPRMAWVNEAPFSADWSEWTRAVIAAGGEGVVIRDGAGACWRAKPRQTIDRFVRKTYTKPDRHGSLRLFADLGAMVKGKPRTIQTVLVPEDLQGVKLRGRVVVVLGASINAHGIVRHARIADVRPLGEKRPADCTL